MRPRLLLAVVGFCLGIVAWETLQYPPTYLAFASTWAALAAMCGATSLLAALWPTRGIVAASGATLVASALGRAAGITGTIVTGGVSAPQLASFTVAAVIWTLVAVLAPPTWKHYVTPWALMRGRDGGR
tara:strand:+ start:1597 stop:1983 length:387 start_codon:yes stop_codon:yes gene_type:complete